MAKRRNKEVSPANIPAAQWRNRIVGSGFEDAEQLCANPRNWRIHPGEQQVALAGVLDKVGWVQNVVVNQRTGFVVDGHLRVSLAISAGEKVPVLYVDLSEEEEALILATIDPLSAMAVRDAQLLHELTESIRESELGQDMGESLDSLLEKIEAGELGRGSDDPSLVPPVDQTADEDEQELPSAPVSALGDLWLCGQHRILCGDCRDLAVVRRLFCDDLANVVITSPPYAEQREYDPSSGFRPIPPSQYVAWYRDLGVNIHSILADDGSYFLNIKPSCKGLDTELYVFDLVLAHVREWGFHFATEFCWERNGVPKSVTQRFKNQFEPVYQFAKSRWKMRPDAVRHQSDNVPVAGGPGSGETSWGKKQGGRGNASVTGSFGAAKKRRNGTSKAISDVQGVAKDAGEYIAPGMAYPGNRLPTFASTHKATGHTAAFPVGLPDFFIRAYTDINDIVFDPFTGSGSTLIASEKTDRVFYGTEISPGYCDVIVQRWQALTGKSAVLESDGRTFVEIKSERLTVAA